jgi:hypothetical protein
MRFEMTPSRLSRPDSRCPILNCGHPTSSVMIGKGPFQLAERKINSAQYKAWSIASERWSIKALARRGNQCATY